MLNKRKGLLAESDHGRIEEDKYEKRTRVHLRPAEDIQAGNRDAAGPQQAYRLSDRPGVDGSGAGRPEGQL